TIMVLAVEPSYVKAGEKASLSIVGTGVNAVPNLGEGVKVEKVTQQSPFLYTVKVAVDKKAATQRKVLGDGEHAALAVYQQLEKVTVTPDFAVARVGGDGRSEERRVGKSVDVRGVRWVGKNESY